MKLSKLLLFAATTALAAPALSAQLADIEESSSSAAPFYVHVGLVYLNGVSDLEDAFNSIGFELDSIPVGARAVFGQTFDIGLGYAVSVGPAFLIGGDTEAWGLPFAGMLTYYPLVDKNVSPFVRAGVAYIFAGGDYVESGDVGFEAAVGIDIDRFKNVGYGFEVGVNNATVKVERNAFSDDVEVIGLFVGGFVAF